MTTFARQLALAISVLLIAAPAASAVGVAYIDKGNIQVSTLDGSAKAQITNDGSERRRYFSTTQSPGGFVFAAVGPNQSTLKQYVQYSPLGAHVSEYPAPYDVAGGWLLFAYPVGFEIDPAKTTLAWGHSYSKSGALKEGTSLAPAGHTAGSPPFELDRVLQPTWMGNRIVGANSTGDELLVQDATGQQPYEYTFTRWLAVTDPNIELDRVVIAPNGTTYAIEYTNNNSNPGVKGIELHRHTGPAIPDGDDTIACDFPTAAKPERVTFSPDNAYMAWRDAEGVKVARVPDLTAPGTTCPPPSPPTVISATGESPSLGGIDVPALIASRNTTTTPTTTGTGDGNGDRTGDTRTGGADATPPSLSFAAIKQLKLAAALKKGVAFKLSLSEPCRLDAELLLPAKTARKLKLKRAIGKARSNLPAGSSTVKVKASKAAQKKLKRQRSLKLVLTGSCTDTAGNAARVNRSVTLKR